MVSSTAGNAETLVVIRHALARLRSKPYSIGMLSVVAKRGLPAGKRYPVDHAVTIGRENADIIIDDRLVSRRHATLRPAGDGLEIEDLKSRNGTWVNGTRVQGSYALADRDVISIGAAELEVEFEGNRRDITVARAGADRHDPTTLPPPTVHSAPPTDRFGSLGVTASSRSRRPVDTRRVGPLAFSIVVIIATAGALVLYFALRAPQ
jgi:predicted component of type VI protein secretion system